jgi:hypothetical protein
VAVAPRDVVARFVQELSNVTLAFTGNRVTQLQQWGPGRTSGASTMNGGHNAFLRINPRDKGDVRLNNLA